MSDSAFVAAREQQRQLYGRPLGDLVHELTADLRITQGRLAAVLGVSAPMLSQLVSGQRVKFGNPSVVGRLQGLVDLAARAGTLTAAQLDEALDEIRSSVTTLSHPRVSGPPAQLREAATSDELREAADVLQERWPVLADLLRAAADG